MSLFDLDFVNKPLNDANTTNANWIDSGLISYKRLGSLKENIGEIKPNAFINFFSNNEFSAHELLFYLLTQTGPAQVYIACWTISEKVGRIVAEMITAGLITSLNGVLDNTSRSRHPADFHYSKNLFTKLAMADVHAKLCVIKNNEWTICFFGSANFTTNNRIERGAICTHKDVAMADLAEIDKLMNLGEKVIWN